MAQTPTTGGTAFPGYSADQSGGYYMTNLLRLAQFLVSNGYSRTAAAGVAGAVAGESGGDPESTSPDAAGLIQWTPPSKAAPAAPVVTGDPQTDFDNQLTDILHYNNTNGNVEALKKLSGDPVAASDYYSQNFERPAVLDSDVRSSVANDIYSALANYQPDAAYTQYSAPSAASSSVPWYDTAWTALTDVLGFGPQSKAISSAETSSATGDLGDIAGALTVLAEPFTKIADDIDWLFHPNHWLRIGCVVLGGLMFGGGLIAMTRVGKSGTVGGEVAGVPVGVSVPGPNLPMAIFLTGAGAGLLFIGLHNLPSNVTNVTGLVGYVAGEIRNPGGGS
jgi:hypothetical protein